MRKVKIGIAGGIGIKLSIEENYETRLGTPYGPLSVITLGKIGGKTIAFLPRHGKNR